MHLPPLIIDLTLILSIAAVVTFIFRRIHQPVVVGYLIAGMVVGSLKLAGVSVTDKTNVKVWADLGVIFLMFSLGLKFSFRKMASLGFAVVLTGLIEVLLMISVGYYAAHHLGWDPRGAWFVACMLAISSTTVIVKALDELGLGDKQFASHVLGILIVEDLAAILILVALSSVYSSADSGLFQLLIGGVKLVFIIGSWLLVGMFVVPRFVGSVSRYGNNELLTLVSLGLCLALVSLSAYLEYSVALGAFIMGSILAETSESGRIENIMAPLKDLFGAIFFVSIGMLFSPEALTVHTFEVVMMAITVVAGKFLCVTIASLLSGRSLLHAIQAGSSLGQIGEFSFIIAGVGVANHILPPAIYPVVVAVAVITTFVTPYCVRAAIPFHRRLESSLPDRWLQFLNRYRQSVATATGGAHRNQFIMMKLLRWVANTIMVTLIFRVSAEYGIPLLEEYLDSDGWASLIAWMAAFFSAAPFIWAMTTTLNEPLPAQSNLGAAPYGMAQLLVVVATLLVVGILSLDFFSIGIFLGVTGAMAGGLVFFFRHKLESAYQWWESRFKMNFKVTDRREHEFAKQLEPWDARLMEVEVHPNAPVVGQSLRELRLGEQFGLNVVIVKRGVKHIVAPKAEETILPHDVIFLFGTDQELSALKPQLQLPVRSHMDVEQRPDFALSHVEVKKGSRLLGRSIRESGIREEFGCLVVGLERNGVRLKKPDLTDPLQHSDLLWIVGEKAKIIEFEQSVAEASA